MHVGESTPRLCRHSTCEKYTAGTEKSGWHDWSPRAWARTLCSSSRGLAEFGAFETPSDTQSFPYATQVPNGGQKGVYVRLCTLIPLARWIKAIRHDRTNLGLGPNSEYQIFATCRPMPSVNHREKKHQMPRAGSHAAGQAWRKWQHNHEGQKLGGVLGKI